MTDDFDLELRNRLTRLAAAVPVDTGSALHTPIAPVVRPGSTSRRFAVGAFAPLVVVVVVATVVASLAGIGPFAPAATGGTLVVSAVRDGPFELTITSAKSRYGLREPIKVTASLTFLGPEGSVSIAHGHGSPMAFGVIERVDGLFLTPAWRQSCERSVLERDIPLERPFTKSGSFSGDNPAASDAAGFFEDPTFELPAGTWHLYVVADFGVGDCGVDRHLLRADLEIVVQGAAVASTSAAPTQLSYDPIPTNAPAPTTGPDWSPTQVEADGGVRAISRNDGFELRLRASSDARFTASTPVIMSTTYEYLGPDTSLLVGQFAPEIAFSIEQFGVPITTNRQKLYDSACSERDLSPGFPIAVTFNDGNLMSIRSGTLGANFDADLKEGILLLPAGRWRITASFAANSGGCPAAGTIHAVGASIDFEVIPATSIGVGTP